ncbi:Plexin domain-containing protein 2 [Oryzias melastigma]|uniref:Plexin domain-containing protein 2 n=1 Tax=Oryzias melastigma TaxID=30732 RepID=A0A834KW18_ORYME|nr:Plexin domain-containing protein 2 [Oryzias melastigma]
MSAVYLSLVFLLDGCLPQRACADAAEQVWPSGLRTGASGFAADRRGLYRDQEDLDPDLLMAEKLRNSTQIVGSDHAYYTSRIYGPGDARGKDLWVNVRGGQWKVLGFLSNSHRQAERVNLSFSFPFYGHPLKEVTVATGGFIYTGAILHRMLTATQYIAPLMANFDPSLSSNSTVMFHDNETVFPSSQEPRWWFSGTTSTCRTTSVWEALPSRPSCTADGRIVFAYKQVTFPPAAALPPSCEAFMQICSAQVPVDVGDISSEDHPVKVGLSDAFVVLQEIEQIPNVRRRTIYEYHKVDILKSQISSCAAVELLPLPSKNAFPFKVRVVLLTRSVTLSPSAACLQFSSCGPCVSSHIGFNCSWCRRLQRCSSGFDRSRQDWVDSGCPEEERDPWCLLTPAVTPRPMTHSTPSSTASRQWGVAGETSTRLSGTSTDPPSGSCWREKSGAQKPASKAADGNEVGQQSEGGLQSGPLAAVVIVTLIVTAAVLTSVYMYNHPTSTASLFFMERRPTHWPILKFRRGSGRPSYAEVETPGQDRDGTVVIDLKPSFVMTNRRESEQREGFIVPDQRERFLRPERS